MTPNEPNDALMTFERFQALAEIYGGDLSRWPEGARAAGRALAARDPRAAQTLAAERLLDAALVELRADAPTPSGALVARVLTDASREARSKRWLGRLVDAIAGGLGGVGPARLAFGGWAAAAVMGLVVGLAAPSDPPSNQERDGVQRLASFLFEDDDALM